MQNIYFFNVMALGGIYFFFLQLDAVCKIKLDKLNKELRRWQKKDDGSQRTIHTKKTLGNHDVAMTIWSHTYLV